MGDNTRVILIRHAESQPTGDLPESDWPLSERGVAQAASLIDALSGERVDAIVSSPYVRAHDTVRPLAERRGLPVELVADLRERKLTLGHDPAWRTHLEQAWRDFDYALPGCESSAVCQARVQRALRALVAKHAGQTVVAASHGNAIALFLNSLDPRFDFERWRALTNPDAFVVTWGAVEPTFARLELA